MLDDLRNSANSPFIDEDEEEEKKPEKPRRRARASGERFLGMTPAQRFIISFILFLMVCMVGAFCLILTERIWLPVF